MTLNPETVTILANMHIDEYDGPIMPFAQAVEQLVRDDLAIDRDGKISKLIEDYGTALMRHDESATTAATLRLIAAFNVRNAETTVPLHKNTVLAACQYPSSVADICNQTGALTRQVRIAVNRLHRHREIHICGWELGGNGQMCAIYVAGVGQDVARSRH